jgi:superfamily II DNA or RNA helicase
VDAIIRKENCLIKSGTGSGKTTAMIATIARLKTPTLVVVHSSGLLDQWAERVHKELGMPAKDIGIVGSGTARVRDLTIGIQKSVLNLVQKDDAFRNRFGCVFADEVHKFAATTFFGCIDPFPARYRVGASDDVKRKDRKEFLIHDLFGDVAESVSDEELIDGGHVLEVEVIMVPTNFRADWYGIPTEEDDSKRPEFGRLIEEMADDPARNALITSLVEAEVGEGRQVLAMAHRREHCLVMGARASASGAATGYLIGGLDYREEFRRTSKGLTAGSIRVGVGTYQACGTGIDIPSIEVGIAATPILSNKGAFRQVRGRMCRAPEGKKVARLYALWDRHVYGFRHLENACRWNGSTFVLDGHAYVPGREYLKTARRREKEQADG